MDVKADNIYSKLLAENKKQDIDDAFNVIPINVITFSHGRQLPKCQRSNALGSTEVRRYSTLFTH